ncbi:tRNA-splicing endonuclease subunit Sen2-like [Tropilaelaps mercedesae]|uniref:tRNA-splicing endonuclease subunit Sen2 n=1 Tax=Tropilaelaps mercedesae TaxID=418985 RepID=A0A1V9X4E9_9ACAR|nr:tRNA-splicing endonuclease subunit Sen2-like [Tropilaelaps mercedesae]
MDVYSIRRKNNSSKKGSIFPLVSQLLPDDAPQRDPIGSKFCIFEGKLCDGVIIVSNKDHVKDIYSGGFFGKGSCSYGEPKFDNVSHDRIMKTMYEGQAHQLGETNQAVASIGSEKKAINCKTTDSEELILTPEEAFFLAFGLGILRVRRSESDISLDELYTDLVAQNERFPVKYAAYHHFRQKGWVVRPGISMGVDFLLYKDGPPFTHSSFMVLVRTDDDDDELAMEGLTEHRLDVLTRISGSVQKVLLLCYVLRPPGTDLSVAASLRDIEVCEIITSRWEPNKR